MNSIIFDMDGVIFDSERKVMECWMEIAEKYGIPGMEEPLRLCLGVTRTRSREIMQARYGADFPYDAYAAEASALFHGKYDGGLLPVPRFGAPADVAKMVLACALGLLDYSAGQVLNADGGFSLQRL